jgi:hypothetical protein
MARSHGKNSDINEAEMLRYVKPLFPLTDLTLTMNLPNVGEFVVYEGTPNKTPKKFGDALLFMLMVSPENLVQYKVMRSGNLDMRIKPSRKFLRRLDRIVQTEIGKYAEIRDPVKRLRTAYHDMTRILRIPR